MAVQLDSTGKDDKNDIKTHFVTREGVYRILNLSSEELLNPRPRPGVGYQSNHQSSPQVRVSFVSLPPAPLPASQSSQQQPQQQSSSSAQSSSAGQNSGIASTSTAILNGPTSSSVSSSQQILDAGGGNNGSNTANGQGGDRICFNIGKELYVYSFKGIRKVNNFDSNFFLFNYIRVCPHTHTLSFVYVSHFFSSISLLMHHAMHFSFKLHTCPIYFSFRLPHTHTHTRSISRTVANIMHSNG